MNLNQTLNQTEEQTQVSVINQTKAHDSRSSKYKVIETQKVIEAFEAAGFSHKLVQQERSSAKYKGFGTHLIKFTHEGISFNDPILDQEIKPVLYFKNSYHGRTKAVFDLGLYRFYCLNGLVLGDSIETIALRHMGISNQDIKGVIEQMKVLFNSRVKDLVLNLKETQMSQADQLEYAEMALRERVRNNANFKSGNHEILLTTHRVEDHGNNAWVVYNRVQENLGLNYTKRPEGMELSYLYDSEDKDGNVVEKERNLSPLKSIKEVNYLNSFLFKQIQSYLPTKSNVESVKVAA